MRADAVRPEQSGDFDPLGFTPSCHHEGLRTYASATFSRPLSRTLAGAHAAAFQTVSADNHPSPLRCGVCTTARHIAPVVHGLQIFAFTTPGADPCVAGGGWPDRWA